MLWPLRRVPPPSLRVKLVLSYLGVALGAILLLVVVISLAVQNYFYTVQINQLRSRAEFFAQQVDTIYSSANKNWNLVPSIRDPGPELFEVIDAAGNHHNLNPPDFVQLSPNDLPFIESRPRGVDYALPILSPRKSCYSSALSQRILGIAFNY